MSLHCTHCQSAIEVFDEARQIATCPSCSQIVDLQPQMAGTARMRAPVELPQGMTMRRWWDGPRDPSNPGNLEIKRRWLRSKHFMFLLIVTAATAFVAHGWTQVAEASAFLIIATIVVVSWDLRLLQMFVNATTITVTGDRVRVRNGPMPSLLFKSHDVSASQLKQLYATKWGSVFEVGAELQDGSRMSLIRPLVTEEQALYVEQTLENQLGIVDFEVEGELEAANLPGGTPAPVSSGAGGAIAVVPIIVGIALFAAFSAFSSSLEGSLKMSGELGDTTFTPDGCESGQLNGFFGAQLTSEASSSTIVRAIKDPAKGTMIAVEQGGKKPVVFTPEQCKKLEVNVRRTNTSVNEVWVVEGHTSADCPGLQGTVKFDGCH